MELSDHPLISNRQPSVPLPSKLSATLPCAALDPADAPGMAASAAGEACNRRTLDERGIAAEAAAAGWRPYQHEQRPGMRFPVPYKGGVAYRWKALDAQKPKNLWLGGKPKACKYYFPQGIQALLNAIQEEGGVLWIANGEPSLLSYLAAGVDNVLCWFGEGSIPHTFAEDLQKLGVKAVYYPVDKDTAGTQSASAVRKYLKDSDVAFLPLQWGESMPDGGDANDAWQQVGFDPQRFMEELHCLKALLLPADEPPAPKRTTQAMSEGTLSRGDAIEAVIQAAKSRPGRHGRTQENDDYVNFCCLLHDEKEPSAGINTLTGTYNCFVCGSFRLEEVAEKLGINYTRHVDKRSNSVTSLYSQSVSSYENHYAQPVEHMSAISPYFHRDGLPDTWIKTVCKIFKGNKNVPKFVRLYFEAARQGLIDPQDMTRKHLEAARTTLNVQLTDAGLYSALKLTEELIWNLYIVQPLCSNSKLNTRGAPEQHFKACTLAEIEAALPLLAAKRLEEARHIERKTTPKLTDEKISVLSGDARRAAQEIAPQTFSDDAARVSSWIARTQTGEVARSLKDLTPTTIRLDCKDVRDALFATDNDPEVGRPTRDVAREYGVSVGTALKLGGRSGLYVHRETIDCKIVSADSFARQMAEIRKAKGGFPLFITEITQDGEKVKHPYLMDNMSENGQTVASAFERGGQIAVKLRKANRYVSTPPSEDEQEPPTHRHSVTYHEPSDLRPYYGPGYNPSVVLHWLKAHLRRLKWKECPGDVWVNPVTGVKYDLTPPADPLVAFAESAWEAVVMKLEPA